MSTKDSYKIQKALKVRLYPDENQYNFFMQCFGSYRFVYNYHKTEKDNFYNQNIKDKSLSKQEINQIYKSFKPKSQKELQNEFEWMKCIPAITVTSAIRNCDNTYIQFNKSLSGKRKGEKLRFPKFKSKHDNRQSFPVYMISKNCLDWENRKITIPKLGIVRFRHAEDKKGNWIEFFKTSTPKNMTISINPSKEIWCSILFEKQQDLYKSVKLEKSIGLDFSPNSLYVNDLNEGAPNFKKPKQENKRKLTKLERKLARKKKGSKNREKAKIKLARCENHISNIRKDYLEKLSLYLVRNYGLIGIEDLNLKGMMKFSHNAKNYLDCSWGKFVNLLEWKSKFNDCIVIKSDRFYPSSKTCNHCGYVNHDLTLKDRVWICPNCSSQIIRDQNAALNLKENAIKILIDSIKSILLLEQQEVMSVEDIEINLFNEEIYGVSYEAEIKNREIFKKKPLGL